MYMYIDIHIHTYRKCIYQLKILYAFCMCTYTHILCICIYTCIYKIHINAYKILITWWFFKKALSFSWVFELQGKLFVRLEREHQESFFIPYGTPYMSPPALHLWRNHWFLKLIGPLWLLHPMITWASAENPKARVQNGGTRRPLGESLFPPSISSGRGHIPS